ncbi:prepilin-type N-terminal cleavage/methylation domain-containing protein [Stratiformator vulcanicus]|uniref:Prepilin-type N-terminal cleavage/methylation domain-containing protein n=1 Tax=Stratiformator vulcanicus TaxID=2527980 RepID=A0A517QWY2_9PLAN|nr:prepilin-type N-terminal cleavage/methylation domain-containing protein [Stratiformator vulcanicus]QDT36176.1 hypothetical protein Pan189_05310 [Stratiformator vulcanicus]
MNARRGVSLIELMVVLAALSILMTVAVRFVVQVMQSNSELRDNAVAISEAARLGRDLRQDSIMARSSDWASDSGSLTLKFERGHVVYWFDDHGVQNERFSDGDIVGRDRFSIGPSSSQWHTTGEANEVRLYRIDPTTDTRKLSLLVRVAAPSEANPSSHDPLEAVRPEVD